MNLLLSLAACHVLTMGIPRGLEQAEALPIDRPAIRSDFGKGTWTFGTFTAADISHGWTKEVGGVSGLSETSKKTEKVNFRMSEKGNPTTMLVNCVIWSDTTTINPEGSWSFSTGTSGINCGATPDGGTAVHMLQYVAGSQANRSAGFLDLDGKRLDVVEHYETDQGGKNFSPLGVLFRDPAAQLAAIDATNKGKVYLQPGLTPEQRVDLGWASIAMLLYFDKMQ